MVARDLAYHVIGLNTQCLWVTPTPIPGLHCKALNQRKNRLFLEKNRRCELCPGQATTRRACALLNDHVDPTALAKACPGAACAYVGAVARNRRRRHANGHTAWAAAAAPSSSFAFVIRESSSIKGSLSLFDGCLFTFFFLEIVAAAPRHAVAGLARPPCPV